RQSFGVDGGDHSGKSTTARIIARLIDPTAVSIDAEGSEITDRAGTSLRDFRSGVQVVFQDPYSALNPRHTVEEVISAPLRYQKRESRHSYGSIVKAAMEIVGLKPDHTCQYTT